MNMQHRLRSQSLPSLAPLHMSVTLKLRLKRLDMRWRKLAHWYLPKPCRDLALHKLAMAHRSLACNPAAQRFVDESNQVDAIPDDISITELAEDVVRGKRKLSQPQLRMLIELLPYYAPKLTAIAYGHMKDRDFAVRLDRAIERQDKTNGGRSLLPPNDPLFIEARVIEHEE